jgi:hypothetical protein
LPGRPAPSRGGSRCSPRSSSSSLGTSIRRIETSIRRIETSIRSIGTSIRSEAPHPRGLAVRGRAGGHDAGGHVKGRSVLVKNRPALDREVGAAPARGAAVARGGRCVRRRQGGARPRGEEESDWKEIERTGHFPLISGIGG